MLHAAALLLLRPTLLNHQTPLELLAGRPPNISHLRVFRCHVWIHAPKQQRKTIRPHRHETIYLGHDSPNIIRYTTPSTRIVLKAHFANCKFVEIVFLSIHFTSLSPPTPLTLTALETLSLNPDPQTSLANTEVTKQLNLKDLTNQLPGTGNTIP